MKEIFHRTSIRKYKKEPVEKAKIEKMLKAAMAAPSARNQQPWFFYVVTNPTVMDALLTTSPYVAFAKGAPLMFVPCYKKDLPSKAFADIDMSACVENLLLEAHHLGLGGVWIGMYPWPGNFEKFNELFTLPKHIKPLWMIAVGHPSQEGVYIEKYKEEKIHFEDWD